MDPETAASVVFIVFGLGFFLFVIRLVLTTEERDYNRKLNEQREFGYPIPDPQTGKRTKRSRRK
jgi:hypothetical protein